MSQTAEISLARMRSNLPLLIYGKLMNAQAIEDAAIDCLHKMPQKGLKKILAIWDVLFPQLKHEALELVVKELKYDGMTGKLDITLNH